MKKIEQIFDTLLLLTILFLMCFTGYKHIILNIEPTNSDIYFLIGLTSALLIPKKYQD